jgi:hypothetical protein
MGEGSLGMGRVMDGWVWAMNWCNLGKCSGCQSSYAEALIALCIELTPRFLIIPAHHARRLNKLNGSTITFTFLVSILKFYTRRRWKLLF